MKNCDSGREKNIIYRNDPINDRCIVFESFWGRSYGCNPAAMYEYISREHPEYECVWFLNDTGTYVPGNAKKVERRSEDYYRYLATAKYFIYNTNMPRSFRKRNGQVIVHTMHGTPFKSFGLDVKEEAETEEKRIRVVERSALWDYLIAQGEFTRNMAWRWFRYDGAILETGYPRTDVLFRPDPDAVRELKKAFGIPEEKKVILYAPTWREEDSFDMALDLGEMRSRLADEYVLLIRLHHFSSEFYEVPEDGEFIFDGGRAGRIEDLYPAADVLITDYSSVMFDFALTGRQMIFFAYDLEEYTRRDRGSYFNIEAEAPGTLARTTGEVIDAILNSEECLRKDRERIESFRQKYLTYEDPHSSERVFDAVFVRDLRDRHAVAREKAVYAAARILPGRVMKKLRKVSAKRKLSGDR